MSNEHDLADLKRRMEGAINAFTGDLSGLRTGRASASLLDPIMVEAYGSEMPLTQVANVTVPEPSVVSLLALGLVALACRGRLGLPHAS